MENFANSSSDFEFKYVPAGEFERIMKRVERDREEKSSGIWGDFCRVPSNRSSLEKRPSKVGAGKALFDEEIKSIIRSTHAEKPASQRTIPPDSAPFFGPARKLDVEALRCEHEEKSKSSSGSSSTLSFHIVEEVNVAQSAPDDGKIQVPNQIDDGAGASDCSSLDDAESLQDELMKLCSEIEKANRVSSGDDDDDSSSDQEERQLRCVADKTEERVIGGTYDKFIDEKFDFLYEQCKESFDDGEQEEAAAAKAQTLPVVEPKPMKQAGGVKHEDARNDNSRGPMAAEQQIKMSGRWRKRSDEERFPSDVVSQKARDVGKMKPGSNEKSQVDVKSQRNEKTEADVAMALEKITLYQQKICQYLDYLREIIDDPPEVDDISDLRKRQQRAAEFANRFARNHLYQIGRAAEEVRLMPDNPSTVAAKVNSLFQVIMQAVSAYLKNVEMFIYNKNPDKLLVLIDFVIQSMKICLDRLVFDKSDPMVQRIMRKCSTVKDILKMNQQSVMKFASIKEKRKKSLSSHTMFEYEVPYGKKLSMYDSQPLKQKRSVHRPKPPKSPYDAPKFAEPSKKPASRSAVRAKPPVLRKTSSNVSTMVQRVASKSSNETVAGKSEASTEKSEFMEMFQGVAQLKVQEMLAPLLAQLTAKINAAPTEKGLDLEKPFTAPMPSPPKPKPPRVTSSVQPSPKVSEPEQPQEAQVDVEKPQEAQVVVRPKNRETIERISKNVQYTYVKSDGDADVEAAPKQQPKPIKVKITPSTKPDELKTKILVSKQKPPVPSAKQRIDEQVMKTLKQQAMKERLNYIHQMMENPLYVNDTYNEPWKLFAEISDKLLEEMLSSVLSELDFGEKSFVESFLRHELEC